jgi:hypothetical protein
MSCKHGDELCDTCLDILGDGERQGREAERAEILEVLHDVDSVYDFHSNCRLCEAIAVLGGGK